MFAFVVFVNAGHIIIVSFPTSNVDLHLFESAGILASGKGYLNVIVGPTHEYLQLSPLVHVVTQKLPEDAESLLLVEVYVARIDKALGFPLENQIPQCGGADDDIVRIHGGIALVHLGVGEEAGLHPQLACGILQNDGYVVIIAEEIGVPKGGVKGTMPPIIFNAFTGLLAVFLFYGVQLFLVFAIMGHLVKEIIHILPILLVGSTDHASSPIQEILVQFVRLPPLGNDVQRYDTVVITRFQEITECSAREKTNMEDVVDSLLGFKVLDVIGVAAWIGGAERILDLPPLLIAEDNLSHVPFALHP